MKMFSKPAVLAAALMLGSATAAPSWSQGGAVNLTDITWTVSDTARGAPILRVHHESSSSTFPLDGGERDLASVRAALGSPNQGAVTFTIDREPGLLTCRGTLDRRYDGSGDCVFAPDGAFEAGLDARGLPLKRKEDLLTMALVDADLALIDGLTRQGLSPRSLNDVIAAAALDVTPAMSPAFGRLVSISSRSTMPSLAARSVSTKPMSAGSSLPATNPTHTS